jgi:hypothetical protein
VWARTDPPVVHAIVQVPRDQPSADVEAAVVTGFVVATAAFLEAAAEAAAVFLDCWNVVAAAVAAVAVAAAAAVVSTVAAAVVAAVAVVYDSTMTRTMMHAFLYYFEPKPAGAIILY